MSIAENSDAFSLIQLPLQHHLLKKAGTVRFAPQDYMINPNSFYQHIASDEVPFRIWNIPHSPIREQEYTDAFGNQKNDYPAKMRMLRNCD